MTKPPEMFDDLEHERRVQAVGAAGKLNPDFEICPVGTLAELKMLREQRDRLVEALRAVLVMADRGPQPMKLDEALTWRENDRKAHALARAALAEMERKP